ncbi:hypothetical protein LWI29_027315 [Acer saccharum]|uniref:Uncharacterized protein n=1 Tax=Acer saccharum TaxID=4024 RepID=A0AA39SZK1_ACESA|nr:hypothetical protein LWI29_027315 [Acer saccharum]
MSGDGPGNTLTFQHDSDEELDEYGPSRRAFRDLTTEEHSVRRPPNLLPHRHIDPSKIPYDDHRESTRRPFDDHGDPTRSIKVDYLEFDGSSLNELKITNMENKSGSKLMLLSLLEL